jgi:hypothetical protein
MSDLSPECVAKRTSTHQSEFMGSRLDRGRGRDKITRRAKFRLTCGANQFYEFARLTPKEGRIAIVTNVGWDAVDAAASGARWDCRAGFTARERSQDVLTSGAEAYGKIVWT